MGVDSAGTSKQDGTCKTVWMEKKRVPKPDSGTRVMVSTHAVPIFALPGNQVRYSIALPSGRIASIPHIVILNRRRW